MNPSGAAPAVPSLVDGFQALAALGVVCVLLALFIWLLRRGTFALGGRAGTSMAIEGALSLGERRSLIVVAVEGRRLLLGVTPAQVTLVTELARASFADALQTSLQTTPEPRE